MKRAERIFLRGCLQNVIFEPFMTIYKSLWLKRDVNKPNEHINNKILFLCENFQEHVVTYEKFNQSQTLYISTLWRYFGNILMVNNGWNWLKIFKEVKKLWNQSKSRRIIKCIRGRDQIEFFFKELKIKRPGSPPLSISD